MSTLLEEAIIDAKALKEAAMKTAENSIIEKYSEEVKKGIDAILEAEMGMDNAGSTNPIDDIPLAATGGEEACMCPEEDEEIEINLSDLADLATDDDGDMSDMESTETALGDLATDEEDEEEDELMEDDIVAQILSALNEDEAPKVKAEEMKVSDQHKMPEMETTEPIKKAQELEEERVEEEDSEVTDKEEDEKNENLKLPQEQKTVQT